jgi:hypothetical protein
MSGTNSGNPQIPQGVINLGRVSFQVPNYQNLNVTPPFMGAGGLSFSRGGPSTTFINTLTGRVRSPEPFQPVTITVHLVRSQALAAAWEAQLQLWSLLGPTTVYTDSRMLPTYSFYECAIDNVGEIVSNAKSAEYMVTIGGTLPINSNLWALIA